MQRIIFKIQLHHSHRRLCKNNFLYQNPDFERARFRSERPAKSRPISRNVTKPKKNRNEKKKLFCAAGTVTFSKAQTGKAIANGQAPAIGRWRNLGSERSPRRSPAGVLAYYFYLLFIIFIIYLFRYLPLPYHHALATILLLFSLF